MSAARAPAPSAPSSAPAVTQAPAPAVTPLLCWATRSTGAGHEVACVHVTCGGGGGGCVGGGGGSCSDDDQDNKKHYDVDRLSATTTTAPAPTHPLLQFAPFRTAKTRHFQTPRPPPPPLLLTSPPSPPQKHSRQHVNVLRRRCRPATRHRTCCSQACVFARFFAGVC